MMASNNPPARPASVDSDVCGVFVVDADGIVVATNSTSRQLWSEDGRQLIGLPLATLFLNEGDNSAEPAKLAEQWHRLKAQSFDRWILRVARRLDGALLEVRTRIERSSGGAGSYIATVQLAPSA